MRLKGAWREIQGKGRKRGQRGPICWGQAWKESEGAQAGCPSQGLQSGPSFCRWGS